jgi:hypothetical protein
MAIAAVPFGRYVDKEEGAHVTISSWWRVDDNIIPARGKIAGAYVNSAFAKSDAQLSGFDEAIVLNHSGHMLPCGSFEDIGIVYYLFTSQTRLCIRGVGQRIRICIGVVSKRVHTCKRDLNVFGVNPKLRRYGIHQPMTPLPLYGLSGDVERGE